PNYNNNQNEDSEKFVQSIKGQVVDLNTEFPLIGANVILSNSNPVKGTVTDENGYFEIENVSIGRQDIEVSYIGYHNAVINNINVISGKETILQIKLEEKVFKGKEIVVRAFSKDKPLNEMAQVSARSFTVEETERYAGGIGDPSRMAASYAGVLTMGTQINDIIIRGNSTTGLLWHMEGLKIPNPNHFGDVYSSGGTSSIINNNVLSNSDFYTGAFPAEFGDAISGVFDLNLRKGNYDKKEYVAQVGFGGLEFGAEGPFVKNKKVTYLANYRYSTMGVFDMLGLNIGIYMIPTYEDFSYNINIPTQKFGKFSFFGIGGKNKIGGVDEDTILNNVEIIDLKSYRGFTGFSHDYFINDNSTISTSIGLSSSQTKTTIEDKTDNVLDDYFFELNRESGLEFLIEYKNKINSKNYLKVGIDYFNTILKLKDSIYLEDYDIFIHTKNIEGKVPLTQSYIQLKHKFNDKLSTVGGIHYQYSGFGDDHAIEPRFSINWNFTQKQSVSFGYGLHSKQQPKFIYHITNLLDTANKVYEKPNKNLKMTRSQHFVLGYNYLFNSNHRLKAEGYYQSLTNVPVEKDSSYKSLINFGSSFSDYDYKDLENKGIGYNYGLEITLEKFLSKGFYYLFTLSLFESKYTASDGITRNTKFNAKAIANILGGYEWNVQDRNYFGVAIKTIWAGGERKIPLNYEASAAIGEAVYFENKAYEEKFKDFFRLDAKIYYKINKKTSHMLAIDVLNATNRKNHFMATYDEELNDYKEESILDIIPSLLWRWNF
ncbi:carboxypeptidase-like regulatory domain-containing protein, partial [Bacteroidota bacterium]